MIAPRTFLPGGQRVPTAPARPGSPNSWSGAWMVETIFVNQNRIFGGVQSMRLVTPYRGILGASVMVLALVIPCIAATRGTKTDFSGTWEMDATRSESAHSSGFGVPVTLVINQTPTEVSIET